MSEATFQRRETTASGSEVHVSTAGHLLCDVCLKVHLKSQFILNGVCVTWRGWLDLRRLDGVGRFEFDEERAQVEFVRYGTTRIRHTVLKDTDYTFVGK